MLEREELQTVAETVADGIRSGTRQQQIFPRDNHSQFAKSAERGDSAPGLTQSKHDSVALRERDIEAAASFARDKPEATLAKHPRLAGAVAMLQAIETHAKASGLNDQAVHIVQARTRENIVKNVEVGNYPEVKVREQIQVQATQEKERER